MEVELGKRVMTAKRMLDNHPVFANGVNSTFKDSFDVYLYGVCGHGELRGVINGEWEKDDSVVFFKGDPGYETYFDEFADEETRRHRPEGEEDDESGRLRVPYVKVHGEEWTPVKVEYHGEMTYHVFDLVGLGKKRGGHVGLEDERRRFTSLRGEDLVADTYEELILKAYEHVRQEFGECGLYDFKTKEEDEDEEPCFFSIPHKNGFSELISNDRRKRVCHGELNHRFWKRYGETGKGREFLERYGVDLDKEGLFGYGECGFLRGVWLDARKRARHLYYNWKYRLTGNAGGRFL